VGVYGNAQSSNAPISSRHWLTSQLPVPYRQSPQTRLSKIPVIGQRPTKSSTRSVLARGCPLEKMHRKSEAVEPKMLLDRVRSYRVIAYGCVSNAPTWWAPLLLFECALVLAAVARAGKP
jgi:hypothetical protein